MRKFIIYSDCASRNNGKVVEEESVRGSFNTIVIDEETNETIIDESRSFYDVTNNQMEIIGGLFGVLKLHLYIYEKYGRIPVSYKIVSDSQYYIKSINEYSLKWMKNNYKQSKTYGGGKDIKNKDIWEFALEKLFHMDPNIVREEAIWVPGHSDTAKVIKKYDLYPDTYEHYNHLEYNILCDSNANEAVDLMNNELKYNEFLEELKESVNILRSVINHGK